MCHSMMFLQQKSAVIHGMACYTCTCLYFQITVHLTTGYETYHCKYDLNAQKSRALDHENGSGQW